MTSSLSLSTVSFHPTTLLSNDDDARDAPIAAMMSATNTAPYKHYNILSSYLSNAIANLIFGEPTVLVTMDGIARRLEEDAEGEGQWEEITATPATTAMGSADDLTEQLSLWQISTLKRRKKMMNKHKLRKRRKRLRLKTRK
eukprot:CAMPEP_0181122492 /NCGR_PEP_ID=MMETSP1071-20121207/25346_1 /TAXON_ID=35127 /ORGANISM="Thalassiosira sp., Strain NH16" /LENGTH=141 /DNA_ID=CAMNT_0023207473 /DNA_START=288 /DNA_END=713 /DNA_ORIENTATION=+